MHLAKSNVPHTKWNVNHQPFVHRIEEKNPSNLQIYPDDVHFVIFTTVHAHFFLIPLQILFALTFFPFLGFRLHPIFPGRK